MENLDKYIDDLFREKLTGPSPVEVPDPEWLSLKKQIRKRNFYRFLPNQFNIFYLSLSILIAGSALTWILNSGNNITDSFKPDSGNSIKVDSTLLPPDTPGSDPQSEITIDTLVTVKEKQTNPDCSVKASGSKTDQPEKSITTVHSPVSTAPVNKTATIAADTIRKRTESVNQLTPHQIRPEETFQNDTLVQTDTVVIHKKGLKLKRKSKSD